MMDPYSAIGILLRHSHRLSKWLAYRCLVYVFCFTIVVPLLVIVALFMCSLAAVKSVVMDTWETTVNEYRLLPRIISGEIRNFRKKD